MIKSENFSPWSSTSEQLGQLLDQCEQCPALAFCDLRQPWPSPEDPWIGTSLWRDYIVTATPLELVAVALHSEDGGSPMLFSCPACSAVPSDHLAQ